MFDLAWVLAVGVAAAAVASASGKRELVNLKAALIVLCGLAVIASTFTAGMATGRILAHKEHKQTMTQLHAVMLEMHDQIDRAEKCEEMLRDMGHQPPEKLAGAKQ